MMRTVYLQDSGGYGQNFGSVKAETTTNMGTRTTTVVTLPNNTSMANGAIHSLANMWLAEKRARKNLNKKRKKKRAALIRATKAQKTHSSNGLRESQKHPDATVIETTSQITLPCNQVNVKVETMPCSNPTAQNDRLEVAIVHAGQMENITVEQSLLVQEGIIAMVDNIPHAKFVPRFDKSYLYNGALLIVCADRESVRWIWERALDIQHWEGWNLQIVRVEELTKFVEVMAYVSKPQTEDTNLIIRRLERQNPGLCTARWTVTERTQVDRSHTQSEPDTDCCLRLKVDEAALLTLESLHMRPYLGLGRAKFELISNRPAAIQCNCKTEELFE